MKQAKAHLVASKARTEQHNCNSNESEVVWNIGRDEGWDKKVAAYATVERRVTRQRGLGGLGFGNQRSLPVSVTLSTLRAE